MKTGRASSTIRLLAWHARRSVLGTAREWRETRRGRTPVRIEHGALLSWRNYLGQKFPFRENEWAARKVWFERNPSQAAAIVAEAEEVLAHRVHILDRTWTLGSPIDWHRDPESGHRWDPALHHRHARQAAHPGGYEIRAPWELSRGRAPLRLAQAWRLTSDPRFARGFGAWITDWIEHNPWPLGVNWACPMEVAIRAVSWLWGVAIAAPALSDATLATIGRSLARHGAHLAENLELTPGRPASNHYLSDLVGLEYLGRFCPFASDRENWLEIASRLDGEILRQVRPEGSDYEDSLHYHRLVLELLSVALAIGAPLSLEARARMEKMAELLVHATRSDGGAPLIGDQDGGRVLPFGTEPVTELLGTAALAGAWLGRADLAAAGPGHDRAWAGPIVAEKDVVAFEPSSRAYEGAGWFVLRPAAGADFLFVSAGASGTEGVGNHSHADSLSFELMLDGQTIVIDPGAGSYTSDYIRRDLLRSARAHSTIELEGQELARSSMHDPFVLTAKRAARVVRWQPPEQLILELDRGLCRHRRSFELTKGRLLVSDTIEGIGAARIALRLQLASDVEPLSIDESDHGRRVFEFSQRGRKFQITTEPDRPERHLIWGLENSISSPTYGRYAKHSALFGQGTVELPFGVRLEIELGDNA